MNAKYFSKEAEIQGKSTRCCVKLSCPFKNKLEVITLIEFSPGFPREAEISKEVFSGTPDKIKYHFDNDYPSCEGWKEVGRGSFDLFLSKIKSKIKSIKK